MFYGIIYLLINDCHTNIEKHKSVIGTRSPNARMCLQKATGRGSLYWGLSSYSLARLQNSLKVRSGIAEPVGIGRGYVVYITGRGSYCDTITINARALRIPCL